MNEAELIKQFRELLNQIEEKKSALESAIKYSNSDKADQLTSDTEILENKKEGIISFLKSSSDITLTSKKIENVKSILIQLKNKFSKKDYPQKFSRDQLSLKGVPASPSLPVDEIKDWTTKSSYIWTVLKLTLL